MAKSPKSGRRSRELIVGFRRMLRDPGTIPTDRKWATEWLLFLEGYTDIKPLRKPYSRYDPLPPAPPVQADTTSEQEARLKELLEEENEVHTEQEPNPSA